MRRSRSWAGLSFCVGLAAAPTNEAKPRASATAERQSSESSNLQSVELVKEPNSRLAGIVRAAEESLQRRPADEQAWYDLVRAWEMSTQLSWGAPSISVKVGGKELTSLADATTEATQAAPLSPRIALIDARAHPDPRRTAEIAARFPGFAPLGLALAQAELAAGAPARAAEVFARTEGIKALPGSATTLASIKLAQHDPKAALAALATKDPPSFTVEIAGSEAYEACGAITRERAFVRYQAELALDHPAAAVRALLDAAENGSEPARTALTTLPPSLARALAELRRKGKLTAFDKEFLRDREREDRREPGK